MTDIALNVVGRTQFPGLFLIRTITSEAAGASKQHLFYLSHSPQLTSYTFNFVGIYCSSDFESLQQPVDVSIDRNNPFTGFDILLDNDAVTLEYDDQVLLRFTPSEADLIPFLESNFQILLLSISLIMIVSKSA